MNLTPHEKIIDEKKFLESHTNAIRNYGNTRIGKTYKDRLELYKKKKNDKDNK